MGWIVVSRGHKCKLPVLNKNPWYVSRSTPGFLLERGTPGDKWECNYCGKVYTVERKLTLDGSIGDLVFT